MNEKCDHVVAEKMELQTDVWEPITLSELEAMRNVLPIINNAVNGTNILDACPKCGEKIDWSNIKKKYQPWKW